MGLFIHLLLNCRTSPVRGRAWSRQRKATRSGCSQRSAGSRGWITWLKSFIRRQQIMKTGRAVSSSSSLCRFWRLPLASALLPARLHLISRLIDDPGQSNQFVIFLSFNGSLCLFPCVNVQVRRCSSPRKTMKQPR